MSPIQSVPMKLSSNRYLIMFPPETPKDEIGCNQLAPPSQQPQYKGNVIQDEGYEPITHLECTFISIPTCKHHFQHSSTGLNIAVEIQQPPKWSGSQLPLTLVRQALVNVHQLADKAMMANTGLNFWVACGCVDINTRHCLGHMQNGNPQNQNIS